MSDRIIATGCPHCGKHTECFVMIGQTFEDICEHCKKTIYFDMCGDSYKTMTRKQLNELEKIRDEYYNKLIKG